MKPTNSNIYVQGTLLAIASNGGSQGTEWNLGEGLLREAKIARSQGALAGKETVQVRQTVNLIIPWRVHPPSLSQPSCCIVHSFTHPVCALCLERSIES